MRKIALHKLIPIVIVFFAAFFATFMNARAECLNGQLQGDRDFWKYMGDRGMSYFDIRNWVADFYNLEEDNWNGGWGYHKWDEPATPTSYGETIAPDYAYPKMMNAGMMLLIGIYDHVRDQSDWRVGPRYQPGGVPAAISRTEDTMDVFLRDNDNKLIHYVFTSFTDHMGYFHPWDIGDLPPKTVPEKICIACDKLEMFLNSDPVVVSRGPDSMDVFFVSGRELVREIWSGSTWLTDLVTQAANPRPDPQYYRYYIHTKPVVVQRSSDTFDVFAFDKTWDHLIHYYWSGGWLAEDITLRTNGVSIFSQSDPIAIARNQNILDVFVAERDGNLIHYYGSPSSGWAVEKLGELPPNSRPAVLSRGPDTLDVFAPGRDFHLIHYYWSPGTGWQTQDLTSQLGGDYFIEGTPAAVLLDQSGRQFIHVFARELLFLQRLYHFSWSSTSGWAAEELSGGIVTDPVALSRQNRLDVVALNEWGHSIHDYWTQLQSGWLVENVNHSPGVSPVFDTLEGSPLIVSRNANTVDLVGRKGDLFTLFTSANGNTLTSWHTNDEYSEFAAGSLHQFEYKPGDDNMWAEANGHPLILEDRVRMCCWSFNGENPIENPIDPSVRAGIMLHEATHENFDDTSHDSCSPRDCDEWIFHTLRDPWFTLGVGTVPPSGGWVIYGPNHTPYQLVAEYSCDISQFPYMDLPQSTYATAGARATYYITERIKDPPGWKCGVPRPIY